ncbi:MAG: glucose-1-phosphate thymidylyltransferase [Chlorobi bacterium]|nr:glucose-1-phosphate thymidylyltransferase [Chlorobiota bacterium]
MAGRSKVKYVLTDEDWKRLLPLTYFRPISFLRVGVYTIKELWEQALGTQVGILPIDLHKELFGSANVDEQTILIDSRVVPTEKVFEAIRGLKQNEQLVSKDGIVVAKWGEPTTTKEIDEALIIRHPADLIRYLPELITLGNWKDSFKPLEQTDLCPTIFGSVDNIYVGENVRIDPCFIDTSSGPVIIDDHAHIMQGAMISGPVYIGPHSVIKMGAKIYGPVALGPYCKVGGEVSHTIFQGYSNKAHDGFIGHAFISEWVNIGADTNNSNLKNTYGPVKMWDYVEKRFVDTGMQFLGLVMGDHAKAGINTMFNTGTVVGVSANVFGAGFPRTFIPSFAWGGAQGFTTYNVDRALDTARRMMARRKVDLTPEYEQLFRKVFELSQWERWWENKSK